MGRNQSGLFWSKGHARSATEWKASKHFYCGLLSDQLFFGASLYRACELD
jgi:hypothetical protein